ncbi:MAG: hypothetical protein ACJ77N_00090 [Chloroflexota bacterium]
MSASPFGGGLLESVLRHLPNIVASTGAVTLAMGFLVFGKRRRDEQQPAPDDVLEAASARGVALAATAALVPAGMALGRAPVPVSTDIDGHMPRWRRPSLLEARKADPIRNGSRPTVRLAFDEARDPAIAGRERRRIRYRVVRLLDGPDELRANEIGFLDEGDEVILLERSGGYWRVLCPDGQQGWVHKMTLGEAVIEATSVTGAESWTSADAGPNTDAIDDDVLRAFLDSRRRDDSAA